MNLIKRISSWFKTKSFLGITELQRAISGTWASTKYLETYEKSLYVYACVSKIAQKVASNRLRLFQIINSKGETREVLDHPALDLIYRVNPFQTKEEFFETLIINQKMTGNAFVFKVRNEQGKVVELWNLRPDRMTILPDPENYIKGYRFTKSDGTHTVFAPKDIIHLKYPSPIDQFLGISPLKPASMRIDIEEYANTYQRDFFLNNARPDAVLEFEGNLFDDQKAEITESWEARFKGRGNNSRIAVLEGGVKYNQVSLSQREMDYIESMKFTRDDILVAFGVPKSIVGVTDDVNRANAETAMFIFLSETIKPELERLINKLNEELIITEFGEQFFLEYTDPTPEDRDFKLREQAELVRANIMLINEARAERNLPALAGGNSFYMPLGVTPVGGLPTSPKKSVVPQQSVFIGKPMLKMKLELTEAITESVTKAIKKSKSKKTGKKKTTKESRSLLPDADVKSKYYQIVNKRVDKRAKTFQEALLKEIKAQEARVIAKLDSLKGKEMKRKLRASDIFNVKKENQVFSTLALPFITEYYKNAGEEALDITSPAENFDVTAEMRIALKDRADFFAESMNNTTLLALKDTLAEGLKEGEGIAEMTARVQDIYAEMTDWRAEMIARTEATFANNKGTLEGFKQSGVANAKEWIATLDDRTRDEHLDLNGDIVGLEEKFDNGLEFPQEINCRCVIAPAFIE
jgi:HK97 family phage portal protein